MVVMDDEGRENEGDLIIAASHCTTEKMAWMIKHTRYVLFGPVRYVPSLSAEKFQVATFALHFPKSGWRSWKFR